MLRTLLEQERSRVALDLKDVFLVDREAIKLLAFHESNGAELRNCPGLYPSLGHEREGGHKCGGSNE
jgi:hypothetical protein